MNATRPSSIHDPCSCSQPSPIPDVAALLDLLALHHVQDLARQCGVTTKSKLKERSPLVRAILTHLDKKPAKPLRLQAPGTLKPLKLKAGKTYHLGLLGSSFLEPVTSNPHEYWQLAAGYPYPVMLFLDICLTPATGPLIFFQAGLDFTRGLTIEAGTTLITDLHWIRFGGPGLVMRENVRFFGTHPCGFRLEVTKLHGDGSLGSPNNPLISTAARSVSLPDSRLEAVPDYPDILMLVQGELAALDGQAAAQAARLPERPVANGAPGSCNSSGITNAGDGESFPSLSPGNPGESGGDGFSPAALTVVVEGTFSGHMGFSTNGGNGAKGGIGGDGESITGGAGGSMPRSCGPPRGGRPGSGGNTGPGGTAGPGGTGGNGGNAGDINLQIPESSDGSSEFKACAKGGDGGIGGKPGHAGLATGGSGGTWIVFGRKDPIGGVSRGDDGVSGGVGAPAADGDPGDRGFNGNIRINGVIQNHRTRDPHEPTCYPHEPVVIGPP